MNDSVLTTVKSLLGVNEEIEHFDGEILVHINGAINNLADIGIGSEDGFTVSNKEQKWSDFLSEEELKQIGRIQSYVYVKTKLVFDPPANASTINSLEKYCDELEWKLNTKRENKKYEQESQLNG